MTIAVGIIALIVGYVLSVFTWPAIRLWVTGAQFEIARLEAKAVALKNALKT